MPSPSVRFGINAPTENYDNSDVDENDNKTVSNPAVNQPMAADLRQSEYYYILYCSNTRPGSVRRNRTIITVPPWRTTTDGPKVLNKNKNAVSRTVLKTNIIFMSLPPAISYPPVVGLLFFFLSFSRSRPPAVLGNNQRE